MRKTSHRCAARSVLAGLCLPLAASASGWQPPTEESGVAPPPPEARPQIFFSVTGGFEHQFRSSIDEGGRVGATRFNAGVSTRIQITPEIDFMLGVRYDADVYRFSGVTGLGVADPWDDVHTFTFAGVASFALDDQTSLFGGPVFQLSSESGGSWGDAFVGGGVIGATHAFSPTFIIGGGIGIVTQIEDSVRVFPVVILDWEIIDNLRLTTRTVSAASGDTGVELVYDWGGGFETAMGASYRFRRFRLDDGGGIAPDGVGQDTRVPLWGRVGYRFSPNLSASFYGGVVLGGQLRLENSNGSTIAREDYDPAGLIGINMTYRF